MSDIETVPVDSVTIATKYYTNLYSYKTPTTDDLDEVFKQYLPEFQINAQSREELSKSISSTDMATLVKESYKKHGKNSKLGSDGLSYQFFYINWKFIKSRYMRLIKAVYQTGIFPENFKTILVSPIFKSGEASDISNYRPISLINVGLRLFSSYINSKLINAVNPLIHINQQGFLPERNLHHQINLYRFMINQIKSMTKTEIESLDRNTIDPNLTLFKIDFAKAFDSISEFFLLKVLQYLQLPSSTTKFLTSLLTSQYGRVFINGHIGPIFLIRCGTRQGNSLSSTIFVILIELLSRMAEKKLLGIKYSFFTFHHTYKIFLYLDDCVMVLKNQQDIKTAHEILHQFSNLSGLQLQPKKSEVIYLTDHHSDEPLFKESPTSYLNPHHANHPPTTSNKYLGIDVNGENWEDNISNIINRITRQYYLDIPLIQRTRALNTYILSTLYFKDSHDPIPQTMIKQITDAIDHSINLSTFLHTNVQHIRITTPMSLGGFGLLDLNYQLDGKRGKWIFEAFTNYEQPNFIFIRYYLQSILDEYIYLIHRLYRVKRVWRSLFIPWYYVYFRYTIDGIPFDENLIDSCITEQTKNDLANFPRSIAAYTQAWFRITSPKPNIKSGKINSTIMIDRGWQNYIVEVMTNPPHPTVQNKVLNNIVDKFQQLPMTDESFKGNSTKHFKKSLPLDKSLQYSSRWITKWNTIPNLLSPPTLHQIHLYWLKLSKLSHTVHGGFEELAMFHLGYYHKKYHKTQRLFIPDLPYSSIDSCSLCLGSQDETLDHIIDECQVSKYIWTVINQISNTDFPPISQVAILFNHKATFQELVLQNMFLTIFHRFRTQRRWGHLSPTLLTESLWTQKIHQYIKSNYYGSYFDGIYF